MKNRNKSITKATTKICLLCFITLSATGCYSVKKSVDRSYPNSKEIQWPEDYQPEESKFFVHNEIDINASAEIVWSVLIQADEWEDYYEGASNLKLIDNTDGRLAESTVFTWKTMGLDFTSTIKEFEAPYRLGWESNKKSIRGYHAWLIIPTENGCQLITSEAQHGFMTFLQKVFVPNKLERLHNEWLTQIKYKSENVEK
ncbi:SRPBCC family protein [Phaeodactylibacter sp.]|jgi:hypothetical protein|uniref:SRPBCC family protein n=1 Tax=Phaeodactylibacter sp. TaxID=1940289 RepID=UPI0025D48976|nr:SRPBCC family protein [Phaeodactylibacter sp.]MCI4650890.1 SRPBCC family protein [Phaeodactylibacter sp.]MCI5089847.1 SRPBCC family protein [Phaeodactylibacter sp.]